MDPFVWSDELALAAQDHCEDLGMTGGTRHEGSNGLMPYHRIKMYGKASGKIGESLAFGDLDGKEYIMRLFIDDGVRARLHRKNI